MRWKIIVVNAGILAIVTLLTYALLYTSLGDVVANPAERKQVVTQSLRAASAQLALDGLRMERWLAAQAVTDTAQSVFQGGTQEARREAATAQANKLRDAAVAEPDFAKMTPALIAFVDKAGEVLGRNGSALMRGDKLAEAYPSLAKSLKDGVTGSDVWLRRERQEQFFASYAPVRGNDGAVLGAIVVGTPLNDERLARTSDLTSGAQLVFAVASASGIEVIAKSGSAPAAFADGAPAADVLKSALGTGVAIADAPAGTEYFGAIALAGYGDGRRGAILSGVGTSVVGGVSRLLFPMFGVAGLGLLLMVVAGALLGNYIQRPVSELEEGLLAVINGRSDLRFDMEHDELGGLVSRINSLLNALTGVPEDTTDDEGRPSRSASTARDFEGGQ